MRRYPRAAVTGRFQPFHRQHLELVMHALSLSDQVIIGITNPDPRSLRPEAASAHRHLSQANPFSYFERQEMVLASLTVAGVDSARYLVVPFPFEEPPCWDNYVPLDAVQLVRVFSAWEREKVRRLEAGGYAVEVLTGDPASRISATDIRTAIAANQAWDHWVPAGTQRVVGAWEPTRLRRRCGG